MRPVVVLTTGGTIAMEGDRAVPALDAAALTAGLSVEARSVCNLPGAQMTLADVVAVAREALAEARAGRGVVVTHGTDTLEETAVLVDACHDAPAPIVFTGAIRPSGTEGADGPRNLADAVSVARAPEAEGLGTLVCFGGELHAARTVRKTDSVSPRAFGSPQGGPVGYVGEGRVAVHAHPQRPAPLPLPPVLEANVPIVPTWLGDDGANLEAALSNADAVVLVALGAGHVPPGVLAALRTATVPVAATVRPERGALLYDTYGFEGSEADLRAAGVLDAAHFSPQAARMLMILAIARGADPAAILCG